MPSPFEIHAHAKINLFLNLLRQRADGFHEVCLVMQTLALADTLLVTPRGKIRAINFTCSDPILTLEDNLVVQAYRRFYEVTDLDPISLDVHLEKQIPVQAGLGGGSSDAATMLTALNRLHEHAVPLETLSQIAADVGADVPFFLTGGTAFATGRGEIITPTQPLPPFEVALIKPRNWGIPTSWAYQQVRKQGHYQSQDISAWETLLSQPSPRVEDITQLLHNDFEAIVLPHYPELNQAKSWLLDMGLPGVLMSGSGPTLFGLLDDPQSQWEIVRQAFPTSSWWLQRTQFTPGVALG